MQIKSRQANRTSSIFNMVMLLIFIDTLLYGAIVPLIPVYTQKFQLDSLAVGAVFAAYSIGALVLSIPLGLIAEKYGYKKVFVTGMAGLTAATLLYGMVAGPWMLFFSRLIQGIAASASWTAGLAMVAVLYPGRQGEKIGLVMAAMGIGTIAGPPVGGFLFYFLGYRNMFIVLAILCFLLMVVIIKADFGSRSPTYRSNIIGPARIKNKTGIFRLGVVVVVSSGGFSMLEVLLPNYFFDYFRLHTLGIGLVFGLMGLINAVSDVGVGFLSDRWGYAPFVYRGLLASAAGLPFLAFAPNVFLETVFLCFVAAALGAAITPSQPLMYQIISADSTESGKGTHLFSGQGTHPYGECPQRIGHEECPQINGGAGFAYGLFNTFFSLGLLAGPIIGGALAKYYGLLTVLCVFSAIFLTAACLFWRQMKR